MQYVPVVDFEQRPLMPTTPARAERWIKSGKATPFFRKGIFCVRLNVEPSNRHTQPVAVGIDPGSKREGYTVKSKAHTYLNQQFHAVDWVKEAQETSTNARRARRNRKTPCRQPRQNRSRRPIPASTKGCGQFKIRVVKVFDTIFPLSGIGIEDVKALTKKGCHTWNTSFSPLEVAKKWCYSELERIAPVTLFDSYTDTYLTRQRLGLKKSKAKLSNVFDAHCVDSWVLAYLLVGGDISPENMVVMECKPIRIYRRQLHVFNPGKNGYPPSLRWLHVARIEAWGDCQASIVWKVLRRWRRCEKISLSSCRVLVQENACVKTQSPRIVSFWLTTHGEL